MRMTITEKILARAAGVTKVVPGQLVDASIDVVMCHDVTTPPAISMLVEKGIDRVFDPEKIVVTPDHFQPAKERQERRAAQAAGQLGPAARHQALL